MNRPLRLTLHRSGIPCLALGGLLLAGPTLAQPAPTPTVAAVDALVTTTMDAEHISAASVAVVKDGKVLLAKGYGLADRDKAIKATERTVYQLGSVTKQFTVAALLMLVEEGKVSLDAKVTELVPGLPTAWRTITVSHLLTHTSGIADYPDLILERMIPCATPITRDELMALFRDVPLKFEPVS